MVLGKVPQWHDFFYDKYYFAPVYTRTPDFVKLAAAYGIAGIRVKEKGQVAEAIRQAMEIPGPVVIDFVVKADENVFPMIPAGESVHEMLEEPTPERTA